MTKTQKIIEYLKNRYPDAVCALEIDTPWQLLFSTRLAAQCTDKRVNIVAKELYTAYPTLQAFAEADIADLERIIHPCGFFRQKSKDLKMAAAQLLEKHNGQVPGTMEELTALPGIGRKTANLILGDIYGQPAIIADTHLIRITNRLGLTDSKDPYKVELALKSSLPAEEQTLFCHRVVHFGRDICKAQNPSCAECGLIKICKKQP